MWSKNAMENQDPVGLFWRLSKWNCKPGLQSNGDEIMTNELNGKKEHDGI